MAEEGDAAVEVQGDAEAPAAEAEAPPAGEAEAAPEPAEGDAAAEAQRDAEAPPAEGEAPPAGEAEAAPEPAEGDAAAEAQRDAEAPADEPVDAPEGAPAGDAEPADGEAPAAAAAAEEAGEPGPEGEEAGIPADEAAPPPLDAEEAEEAGEEEGEEPAEAESPDLEGEGDVDDFGEMEEDDDMYPDDDKKDPMQELREKYEFLLEQSALREQDNTALQRRTIQWKMQKDKIHDTEKPFEGKVTEHKYQLLLHNVHQVRSKLRLQQVKAARMSEDLKAQLEEKRNKAVECRDSFQEFKKQVARYAEYSRTGKKIPEKIIAEVEDFELDKDAEVEEVRGANISLKNRLAKLDQALRKKDELAENLHVIDFEQLKIENQTLNEKIEERNEELHKLRKKTIVTVQQITHMREKVQFISQEYQALKAELAQLDQDLSSQRDLVAKTKHERDDYRSENAKYRQQTGIVNSELLTKDFEDRTNYIKQLKDDITKLKAKHEQLMSFVKAHGGGAQ